MNIERLSRLITAIYRLSGGTFSWRKGQCLHFDPQQFPLSRWKVEVNTRAPVSGSTYEDSPCEIACWCSSAQRRSCSEAASESFDGVCVIASHSFLVKLLTRRLDRSPEQAPPKGSLERSSHSCRCSWGLSSDRSERMLSDG